MQVYASKAAVDLVQSRSGMLKKSGFDYPEVTTNQRSIESDRAV